MSPESNKQHEDAADRAAERTAARQRAAQADAASDDGVSFDSLEFDREGDTSNTPSPKTIVGGEDWLSLSLYVQHDDFDALQTTLNDAQRASKHDRTPHDEVCFGDAQFVVAPTGTRQGSRTKGAWMAWKLKSDIGVTFLLMDAESPLGDQPNASVRVPSLVLMQYPIENIWAWVQYCLGEMGATILKNKVSRVDACVDLPDVDVSLFSDPFRAGWMVTRARSRAEYDVQLRSSCYYSGTRSTGFCIGKSPILIRVYDKLLESNRDAVKLALLITNRWGREVECATRVEIQISRGRLVTFGVDSLEDWFEKRATICHQVTANWFRLTDGPVDRKHADRATIHPIWQHTIEQFRSWCDSSETVELTPLAKMPIDMSRMVNQSLGNLIGVFARIGKEFKDNEHFEREALARLRDAMKERDLAEEVRRRALELGTS